MEKEQIHDTHTHAALCPHKLETLRNMKKNLGLPQSWSFVKDGYPGAPKRKRDIRNHSLRFRNV